MSTVVTLLNSSSSRTRVRSSLDGDTLRRLDDLYAYYHKQWWCRRQMFYFFKGCHGFLNALAILVMAAGVVVGSVRENSFVVVGLTAFGTVVKGWNDFKKFSFKVDMCRFAYTTYEKTLIELKTYVRGLPLEEFDGFLIRMQTLDEVVTDFTPPVFDRVIRKYSEKFHHQSIDEALKEHKLHVSEASPSFHSSLCL